MIEEIIGRKIGMTQIFTEDGKTVPVTAISVGPCWITQKKDYEKCGYSAVQLGFGEKKEKNINKPQREYLKRNNIKPVRVLKEIRIQDTHNYQLGQEIKVDIFKEGDLVDITSTSKGKGFQGVVRRYGFKGGRSSHGSMFHRAPGSIGASSYPSRVYKGTKMPGRMGGEQITVRRLKIMKIDVENNLMLVKGSIPGVRRRVVLIKKTRR